MRPIDADALCEGRVSNDPVVIAAKCAPTLDYAPVRHGEWIPVWHDLFKLGYVKCSVCGHKEKKGGWAYCHCGAKMDGGKSDGCL